ncbi:hypothetical protein GW17_00030287 [Ensete ventricosum]|nr:hypothetical protein GW17_00030287 [Ensete ventricosum]
MPLGFTRSRRMGDHLALLVDHLLTESTLEAAIGSQKHGQIAADSASLEDPGKEFTRKRNIRDKSCVGKLVECRICQEEEEDYNMEIPCSCCGSLKSYSAIQARLYCSPKVVSVWEYPYELQVSFTPYPLCHRFFASSLIRLHVEE